MPEIWDDRVVVIKGVVDCAGPEQVRVRIKAVGICGSDVHYLKVEIKKYL